MHVQRWPLWITCAAACCGPAFSAEALTDRRLTSDLPLDAVKWTGGFWQDRMRRLGGKEVKSSFQGALHYNMGSLQRVYTKGSPFGPPLREAPEIFGHNTQTAHHLLGATALCGLTGEPALLDALKRLAAHQLTKKTYITGAVAPVFHGERPAQTVNGKTYGSEKIHEAVGAAYELPLDSAYCESCGQCLYMEWYYRMFRLTGEAVYMDAAERALYNTIPGCVDLDRPNFFYCNPQEQAPSSKRSLTDGTENTWESAYTWRRQYTKKAACCPPKVMRALALSAEVAYNVSREGLWVNLYGHSMGAFVTIALAAAASDKIVAAAITSGGVQTAKGSTTAAPTANVAAQVRVPFLILQGAKDTTVPPESSELLKQALDKNSVPNERQVFDGVGHSVPTERSDEVNRLMRDWFTKYGVLTTTTGTTRPGWATPTVQAPRFRFRTFESASAKTKVSFHLFNALGDANWVIYRAVFGAAAKKEKL